MTYDPAFTNTAACKSRITFIDGDKGILNYRGYPIEQLAEQSTYLETAYLILNGELPTRAEHDEWALQHHAPHDGAREHQGADGRLPLRRAPHGDADVDGGRALHVLSRGQAHPRRGQPPRARSSGSSPRCRRWPPSPTATPSGLPFVYPDNDLSYCGNFLQMMFRVSGQVPGEPGAGAGAGGAVHPARRPRAELLDLGHARRGLVRGPIRTRPPRPPSRRSTGRCTAAPTSRCCAC